ncbi:uncharacterized protein LOC120909352 [Rana temporaria]|uniref:uncharacterized protein LOC120909352 n=1 Tax=Rana temporaria TaxID=8407 RepID=UPI001AADA9F5|nr:uncharacterized protein LOC120909352 [Rana temporaria]
MENQPPLTSPDGSSNRNPHSPYYRDSFQEDHTIPHHQQGEDLNDGTVPYVEETSSMADDRCLQDIPPEISRDAHLTGRRSEERSTCRMIKDEVVEDSQGENRVTPNIHPGPYSADTSNSKNSFTKEAHSVLPSVHFGLQNVDRSVNPSISEEPSPMELDTIGPNIPSALSRSPDLSFPIEPPDKLHTAPNIKHEPHGSPHPTNPQESSLDVSCTLSPNIHQRLQNTDDLLDLANPEESTQDKPHTVSSNMNLGLHNTDRPPESKESSPVKSRTINSNIHLELKRSPDSSHPERSSSAQSQTDVNINSGVDSSDRAVDASKPKQSSPINAYILTPRIHSAHYGSGSSAFSLSTPPGVPSVDRSADPSNPRESFATKSHSVTLDMYPEPSNVHGSPVPLNPEACHPMQSQTASADMHSECHRSLDPCCVGESSTTSNTIHDVYSGPHNVDRSLDPDKSSATSHTIPNGNSGPYSAERIPNPCSLNKSFATSHTFSNGNSGPHRSLDPDESSATSPISHVNPGPHSAERLPDPHYLDKSFATSPTTIPHVNSVTHSVDRSQDPCYPQESSATSHTIANVNSGPHGAERLQEDPSYPHKSSDTSPTIPNVNSEVHNSDNPPDPVKSWVSFLMKLHASGSNMHSSLTTSLNLSDPDDSCDKQLPVPNMNSGFRTSSRSPLFTNLGESYPDKSNAVTPNLQPDHYNVDRIPDLAHPGKPQTVTQDVHRELPSVDRTPSSPGSSLTKSHVLIQSKLNKSLDPSYSVESSTSSQTPANIHSSFDKADGSTDYLDPGASSLLKSHTVSSNTQAMIRRSLDPSYPVEPSEISHTALNINAGLHSTSRSLHSSNPNESSLDTSHTVTQNIHHCADRALYRTNPEESSAEIPDAPDIHHSVNRTPDPEVSCPMRSHNITSNTYSEFNSPDPSDKSSLESHTAPHIHSGLQTTDSSQDPPIDYLLSNKLLITLNVHPELYLMDKSSIPSYPEEYSSIKSLIISPNIRSLRGRSPDPSSDEPSDKLHTAPNISLGFQSEDRSLHSSYSELCSVAPNINSEIHSVDTSLDREVSDHMKSQTVTTNLHSLNRSPDSCYPDESTAKSHSSPNNYAGDHIQSKSLESHIAELSPPNVSLNVDSNVLPEHDIANRSPNSSCPMEFCPIKSSIVSPDICSFNRSPDSYYSDVSSDESPSSPNIHAGHHSENRSPDLSIAEQFSPNVLLNVDSNALPEHQSVDRSPSHSDPKDLIPMESHTLMPNVGSAFPSADRSPGPSKLDEYSIDASNIHPKSSIRSLDPIYNPEEPSPTKMYTVCPITPPGLQIVDRSPDPEVSFHAMSQSVNQDAHLERHNVDSPPSPSNPKEPSSRELPPITTNILQELCNAPPCLDSSGLNTMSQSVSQDAPLERHNVDSPPSPNPKEPGSMELPPITTNILQELCNAPPCLDSSDLHTMSQSVTQDAPLERHNVDSPPSPSNPKEPGYMELPPITTNILQELCNAPPCLDSSGLHTMSQSVTQDAPLGRLNVDSPPSPSNPKEPGYMELPPITTNILQELCNAPPCLDSSGLNTMSQSVSQDAPLERHNVDSPPSPNPKEPGSMELPPITTNILQELCNAPPCLDSSDLHTMSQSVTQDAPLERHNVDSPPSPSNPKEPGYMELPPITSILQELYNAPPCLDSSGLHTMSQSVTQDAPLERHNGDSPPSPSNPKEPGYMELPPITTSILQELCNAPPCLDSSGLHTMSQSVTQDAPLECHNGDSPPSPSNPKESRSSESPPITTDILQELCNAHRCLDSTGLHESFQAPALNIYYENPSAHNLADPFGPEELAPNGSLANTPTNHPEICSLDKSPKSSEESSLEKSYYVLPNIQLEPHKADQSPDTSNLQETSFKQTFTVTPNNALALHQTLEASNSEEHSQDKSRALTIKPSNPRPSLPDRSGCATGNADKNGLREISCPVCGRSFRRQPIFLKHWGIYCGKIFKEKPSRKKKPDKKSSPPAKRGKLFKKKEVVLKEPDTQQSTGPYPCPECGKFYSQKSNLLQHRRIHTGLKPFSCLHCGKTFTKKISLVTHIRIHSGEKPFKCKQCGKCFGQQGHLDRHRKMHTGEKPHPCPECDKSFLQKCDLVKHQRIHTGQRPYLCPECGKSFTETSGLKRHRRLHR